MSESADDRSSPAGERSSEPGSLRQRSRSTADGTLLHDRRARAPRRLRQRPRPARTLSRPRSLLRLDDDPMYARACGWEIGDVRVDVDYDHRSTPRRFTIALHLDPSVPPERVERLVKMAESCPVRRAIDSGIEFDEHVVAAQLTAATAARLSPQPPTTRLPRPHTTSTIVYSCIFVDI